MRGRIFDWLLASCRGDWTADGCWEEEIRDFSTNGGEGYIIADIANELAVKEVE